MYLTKLKIDKYNNIFIVNFPKDYMENINTENSEVILYYIDKIEDITDFLV